MIDQDDPYDEIALREDDHEAEGRIMEAEAKQDALTTAGFSEGVCKNCLDSTYVKLINGINLCRMCAERYPLGMPF